MWYARAWNLSLWDCGGGEVILVIGDIGIGIGIDLDVGIDNDVGISKRDCYYWISECN